MPVNTAAVSFNFSVAKVIAILMVVTGHFFTGTLLWIPTTVALFVFGFASGYFTASKYTGRFSMLDFWRAKISRLGLPLLTINLFLLILFLWQGRDHVWTADTLIAMLGWNGIQNWLQIDNLSPFGAGLWFFTVLWLFYIAYPVLNIWLSSRVRVIWFLGLSFIATSLLHFTLPMGHELWMTVFSFLLGVVVARSSWGLSLRASWGLVFGAVILLLGLNVLLQFKLLNYFLILLSAVGVIGILLQGRLPPMAFRGVLFFSGCLMEIYFIHTYLFIRTSQHDLIDYGYSFLLILLVAWSLARLSDFLKNKILPNK